MPWLPESPLALAALPLIALAALLVAHALSRTGTRGRARLVTASVFAALFASGVAVQWQLNARLQSDAFYYFAYLRSIAFDRDVDFTNDYPLLGLSDKAYLWQPPTVTGYAHTTWAIGPAILWAPFFGGAHLAALRQQGQGVQVATDGSSYPYRQAVCIAGLFYALLGTWFSIRAARQFFPASIAATGVALVVGGSFILWYAVAEPTMAHAPTMAVVAAFVWYWTATMGRRSLRTLDRPWRARRLRRPGAVAERAVRAAAGDRGADGAMAGRPRPAMPRPSAPRSSAASPSPSPRSSRSRRRCSPRRRSTGTTWRCRRSRRRSSGGIRTSSTSCSRRRTACSRCRRSSTSRRSGW